MIVAQWKENIIAVGLAWLLAWTLIFAVRNTPLFQANIVNGIQQEKLQDADVVMDIAPAKVELAAQRNFSNVASVSMLVFVDQENLVLGNEHITSVYPIQFAKAQGGGSLLVISNVWNISARDTLVTFVGQWDVDAFSLSDILVTYTDGKTERLALGTRVKQ